MCGLYVPCVRLAHARVCLRSSLCVGVQVVGVMITASHNPVEDNGLKMVDADGGMLAQARCWGPVCVLGSTPRLGQPSTLRAPPPRICSPTRPHPCPHPCPHSPSRSHTSMDAPSARSPCSRHLSPTVGPSRSPVPAPPHTASRRCPGAAALQALAPVLRRAIATMLCRVVCAGLFHSHARPCPLLRAPGHRLDHVPVPPYCVVSYCVAPVSRGRGSSSHGPRAASCLFTHAASCRVPRCCVVRWPRWRRPGVGEAGVRGGQRPRGRRGGGAAGHPGPGGHRLRGRHRVRGHGHPALQQGAWDGRHPGRARARWYYTFLCSV
jgi:hypothetical protein